MTMCEGKMEGVELFYVRAEPDLRDGGVLSADVIRGLDSERYF